MSGHRAIALTAVLALALSAPGCAEKIVSTAPPTIEPARAAVSPPPAVAPAGEVIATGGRFSVAMFDARTRALVCLSPGELTIIGTDGAPRTVPLPPGSSAALTGDGAGTVYIAGRGAVLTVDIAAGRVTETPIAGRQDTEFTAIARRADGRLVLGTAGGAAVTLAPDMTVSHEAGGFARVDGLAVVGDVAVVLDRAQTSVTELDSDGDAGLALRAGLGATRITSDPAGRVLVTDTRGGQLLVFGVRPLIERQAYPVPDAPFGLTGSATLTWVSQTASNTVIGYDLATGIPVEKVRYPTVRQPDSLAFDDASGTLYVVSGAGAGVQVIRTTAGAR